MQAPALSRRINCFFLMAIFMPAVHSYAAPLMFSANPAKLEGSQKSTLSWNSDGSSALLLGYGRVKPSGSLEVAPSVSKTYILVVESNGKPEVGTARVEIKGQKGNTEIPDLDSIETPIRGSENSIKYDDFLELVVNELQFTNHFAYVEGSFLPKQPYVVLYTGWQERNDLRSQIEPGRNKHRIAYSVRVYIPANATISFEIRALVESRPIAESEWDATKDTRLAQQCAIGLENQLSKTTNIHRM